MILHVLKGIWLFTQELTAKVLGFIWFVIILIKGAILETVPEHQGLRYENLKPSDYDIDGRLCGYADLPRELDRRRVDE